MPYLDANVFLYPVLYSPDVEPKVKRAKEILLSLERGKLEACTSTVTWDEIVWIVTKAMGRAEGIRQGEKFIGFRNLEFVNVDENIVGKAQSFMAKYNLRPRDAIHLATATERKIREIISDDADFDKVTEIKRIPL